MDIEKVGKFIALNRKKQNMTQVELASKIGVSSKTVSRWETGKYMPDISLLIPLSEKLNVSVHELLLGEYVQREELEVKSKKSMETFVEISEKKTKKIGRFYIIVIVILLLTGMFAFFSNGFSYRGNVENADKIYEVSTYFSEEEIQDAMRATLSHFEKIYHGCTLKEIIYTDEKCLDSSIAWAENYNVEKCIVLYGVFEADDKGASEVFNAGKTYTYQFILTYTNNQWICRNEGQG